MLNNPNDPNSTMGLSALSPTLSLEKRNAAKSGKTAAQFLMEKGNSALAMLALKKDYIDNIAELQKKMAEQSPAAPPTVAQQYDMAIAQQDQQMAQGLAGLSNPVMEQANFAGGGIVAFDRGGEVEHFAGGGSPGEGLRRYITGAYEEAIRTGNTAEASRLRKLLPTLLNPEAWGKGASTLGKGAKWVGGSLGKYVPPIAGIKSLYDVYQSDPSVLAEEYGMDPSKFGRQTAASVLGYLEGLAGNMSFGLTEALGDTPLERARSRSDAAVNAAQKDTMRTTLSPEEAGIAAEYKNLVNKYGANSREAEDFADKYREYKGVSAPDVESELDKLIAASAKDEAPPAQARGTTSAISPGTRVSTKDLPSAKNMHADRIAELETKLGQMPDLSKRDVREAELDKELKSRMDQYTKMGILKPFEENKAQVQGRIDELKKSTDKDFYKAMAIMGFTMAQTKGSWLQALAAGGAAGVSAIDAFEERRDAALDKLQDRMTQIDLNIANVKKQAGTEASARLDQLEAQRAQVESDRDKLMDAQTQLENTQAFQIAMQDRGFAQQQALQNQEIEGQKDLYRERYGDDQLLRNIQSDIAKARKVATESKDPKIRVAAQNRVNKLMDELSELSVAMSGSAQAAFLRAQNVTSPYTIGQPAGKADNEGWGDVSIR